ncbi:MAG: hypothetical protein LBH43_21580 [Treponema sp.]|jgi:hypothetical protein|nr:hypothetical protein [Treponema sp.]
MAITFPNCVTTQQNGFYKHNFSLKDTLSIFLLKNEKGYYFCIPVQYMGDYHISRFKFNNGNIQIGGYNILLKRDGLNISVYLNETANENGSAVAGFNQIYLEEDGGISVSKMAEPLAKKNEADYMMNHYYIFIEKHLTDNEMKAIIKEYERGNIYSRLEIWYDLTIDNEDQNGSGILDEFEFYDGLAIDPVWFPQNLNFFKDRYLQK